MGKTLTLDIQLELDETVLRALRANPWTVEAVVDTLLAQVREGAVEEIRRRVAEMGGGDA